MREIEIFQPNSFVMNFAGDAMRLSEKLKADNILLSEIQRNFSNLIELMKALLNYNINLHTYNLLLIEEFFFSAMQSETNNIAGKDLEEMRSKGWILFKTNYSLTTYKNKSVEQKYQDFFFTCFNTLFVFDIGNENSLINKYYHEAIFAFKNQKYYSCTVSLFPIIEFLHQELTGFNGNQIYKIKENVAEVNKVIGSVEQPFRTQVKYYDNLVNQMNELIINHYFAASKVSDPEPQIICRNRLMHGIFTREISEKDCLQLFCVVSTMRSLYVMINADKERKRLIPIIDEMTKKLKALQEKENVG